MMITNYADKGYLDMAKYILDNGIVKEDRTGVGTISVFGTQTRYDLTKGFPLLTTKKIHIPSVVHELLWFIKGDTNTKYLVENGVRIWNEWADENGDLGKIYGHQWRSWEVPYTYLDYDFEGNATIQHSTEYIDQLQNVIEQIKDNPNSRRLIVSAWNVGQLDEMNLPPCHLLFQFYVADGKLSCQLYQRSCDVFLGCPFNVASYSLLIHMIARLTGLEVGEFIHTTGDTHIYLNHVEQIQLQLTREHRELPTLVINPDKEFKSIDDFTAEDFEFINYNPHPTIKGKVAV